MFHRSLRVIALGLTCCLALVSQAAAQECSGLATQKGRSAAIAAALAELRGELNRIESVPPDIDKYINSELQQSARLRNKARLDLVKTHKYYYAQQFHKSYNLIIANLEMVQNAKNATDEAIVLSYALSNLSYLQDALRDYIGADARRANRILTPDDVESIWFGVTAGQAEILRVLQCAITQLANRC